MKLKLVNSWKDYVAIYEEFAGIIEIPSQGIFPYAGVKKDIEILSTKDNSTTGKTEAVYIIKDLIYGEVGISKDKTLAVERLQEFLVHRNYNGF